MSRLENPFPPSIGMLRISQNPYESVVSDTINLQFREELLKRGFNLGLRHFKVSTASYSFILHPLETIRPRMSDLADAKPLFTKLGMKYDLDMIAHGDGMDGYGLRNGRHESLSLYTIDDITLKSGQFDVEFRCGEIRFRANKPITESEMARMGLIFNDIYFKPAPGQDIKTLEAQYKKS